MRMNVLRAIGVSSGFRWAFYCGLFLWFAALTLPQAQSLEQTETSQSVKVFIVPVREGIDPPITYLVRRGVKAAMESKASLLALDMETYGGRLDTTEEIIQILSQFKGQTLT